MSDECDAGYAHSDPLDDDDVELECLTCYHGETMHADGLACIARGCSCRVLET